MPSSLYGLRHDDAARNGLGHVLQHFIPRIRGHNGILAQLHDIARLGPGHAELGARWLETLGYPAQAGIIRLHHESPEVPLEAAVVSIADKCISGTRRVGLEERFDLSLSKCGDEQARQAHARRRAAAEALRDRINSLCGKEVIP